MRAEEHQSYPDHPERFDHWLQVLCREGLTGRCYWEVERERRGITRRGRGRDSVLGCNNKSWCLNCYDGRYTARYNDSKTDIPLRPLWLYQSRSVCGPACWLSVLLQSVPGVGGSSHTLTLIPHLQTTFTQEDLLPGIGFNPGSGSSGLCVGCRGGEIPVSMRLLSDVFS
ncbi:Neoverrucotoxin subunit alpha [Merluccius polli]|uniref:Neoverrucotoxin subunit alpha n=1 Tax=Merluccius polli TaxID=89951 RepID=A0AA47M5H1_MERPO|nr:Neoverrucotoxin subunit alpha [Merluccius polli]